MSDAKKKILEYIDENADIFTAVSDKIWENPELSLKESYATRLYCDTLREAGFEVTENLCGIPTAFCGKYGEGKPVIGILGEYDALSGLSQQGGATEKSALVPGGEGHGCGHNLLGAGSLAAAFAVMSWLKTSGKPGTVVFYGCPGEEGGSGKAFMARDGLWRTLDAALSWHPSDVNEIRTGTNNSCIQVLYKFHGVSAHAAGDPENGRSALDAVELMNIGVQFLREHMTTDCRVHYAVVDSGGVSPNVVQAEASVLYMVRANKVADSALLQKRVDAIAEGAALMTGTAFERIFIDGTAELLPNYTLEKLLQKNFEEIGVPQLSEEEQTFAAALKATYPLGQLPGIGPVFDEGIAEAFREKTANLTAPMCDFVLPEFHGTVFVAGSTDVGDVSWQTPTSQINAACFPLGAPGHSWQNVSCGRTAVAKKGMLNAGKVLACAAVELLESPEILAEASAEFKKRSASGYVCPIEPGAVPRSI
ncbi:MAG: M20 family metallopeptidase [Oscillospiraceae bacterium]